MMQKFTHYTLIVNIAGEQPQILQSFGINSDNFLIYSSKMIDDFVPETFRNRAHELFNSGFLNGVKDGNNLHLRIPMMIGEMWLLMQSIELGIK